MTAAQLLGGYDDYINGDAPAVAHVDLQVPIREVNGWRVTADIHRPVGDGPFPVLVYLHGGAWIMGAPATHRRLAAELAQNGLLVVVVDYRRAPKHRFPGGVEDTIDAVGWVREHIADFGGDPATVLIGGDSAGANLAAAAIASGVKVQAALLFYGIYDVHRALPTIAALVGEGENQLYLTSEDYRSITDDPRLHPERYPDTFPPTLVLTGDGDPAADESYSLAARLGHAGIDHQLVVLADSPHGILQLPGAPGHGQGLAAIHDFLQRRGLTRAAPTEDTTGGSP
ncbi:alpha/beta hydrolase fold domain-containing protein [Nakamurella sp. YIM 132087]|uniref:Alpha/beta hydrolase fold domain-containing protein n=1 Tax=Nakamurella alba TaxID=2665158 RepID=A0A7K1FM42_9ACTN|nr:alpha/beta hydrolase fold domain-containing protein [Nakamurella alba]MTD15130.1 alpha/beta hydrolase fold domain-containing protein [Nakamurella alba]